ncbi:MAG: PIN domain-containing protein [Selenomonadaceae bacterium]|nr:PIN domain-containing protein [Selenomonadaceae bacterium]
MTALIDTCIILDALQERKPFDTNAKEILEMAQKKIEGVITAKSITDIYYLYMRSTHNKDKTIDAIKKLFSVFIVVDTLAEDCYKACFSSMKDYEDAVMEQTAKRMHLDCIITRNIKDYKNSVVKIFSPEEFLMNFVKEQEESANDETNGTDGETA